MADGVSAKPRGRPAMKAVTTALAGGAITPGEPERIAAVVDTFVRAIETSDSDWRLQFADASLARNSRGPAGISVPDGGFNL